MDTRWSPGNRSIAPRADDLRRRVRTLVPAPVRRADLAVHRAVAGTTLPVVGPLLRPLSRAANRSGLWLAVAAALHRFGGSSGSRAARRGVLAIAATSTLTNLPAKLLTGRPRPRLDLVPEVRRLARVPTSTSFPSGHAASAFAFATAVGMETPRLRTPLTALAGVVAFSRVYTGVHYPGDVLAGAAIGRAVARATVHVWPLIDPHPAAGQADPTRDLELGPDGAGLVIVANAGAGNRLGAGPEAGIETALPAAHVVTVETGERLPGTLRRAAGSARALGVAGGDGSANAAAAVAIEHGLPLALIPAGTLNHLATDLGVEELAATVRAVRERRAVTMDVGDIAGRVFLNAASIGTYPYLVAERERLEGRLGKWPAAAWCLLKSLVAGAPFALELDGRRRNIWQIVVCNGRFTTSGLAPTGRTRLDEGVLEVRLADAERPWSRLRLAVAWATGNMERSAVYERWICTRLEVRSLDGPLRLATDGESWQGPEAFSVVTRPRALAVLQPTPEEPPRRVRTARHGRRPAVPADRR